MKAIVIAALAVGIWVVPFPHESGQPKERIVQSESAASAQQATDSNAQKRTAESEAIERLISQEVEIQRQNAQILQAAQAKSNEEIAIEGKIVKYTGALVWVGVIQAIVFFFTLLAIKRQADIMKSQFALSQPRLHVDGVRAGWFRKGERPVFFVKIMNSGLNAAEDVAVRIHVQLADRGVEYQADQKITIPAQGWRECLIVSLDILDETALAGFESDKLPLRVSGHVIWNKKTIPYGYKYYPWPYEEPRPAKLRRFVTDDFDTRRAISVNVMATGLQLTASLGTVLVKGESGTPTPPPGPPNKPTEDSHS